MIKELFLYIKGSKNGLTLENQVFNITAIIGACLLFFMSIFNAIIQIDIWGVIIPLIVGIFLSILYYYARHKQKFIESALLSIPLLYGLTGIMWFINGGQSGSIIHALQIDFLLFFAVLPRKYHLSFTLFHILMLCNLYILEYFHPEWIMPYKGRSEQLIDQIVTLSFSVICVYAVMMSINAMYEEKNKEVAKQKEALQELNDLKDKMLSVISHDVRSPLAQLKSLLYVVTETDITKEKADYLFKHIAKNVDETQHLLDTLVTWASIQLQEGIEYIKAEKIDLKNIVSEESNLFIAQIQQKNITLICEIPYSLYVVSDVNILALVMRNLLSNAIKFTPSAGEINISAQQVSDYVVLSIRDTGVGIAPERLQALLQFGKNSTTRGTNNEKGSGLGLLLCKEFIEKSGGKLHIESELNKGTTFYVSIPSK